MKQVYIEETDDQLIIQEIERRKVIAQQKIASGTISVEPALLLKDGDYNVEFTLDSNIYENNLGGFMLNPRIAVDYKDVLPKVMDGLVK